jgi:hypothetical protein
MTKRKTAIAAAAMAAAVGNSVFVLASRKESLPASDEDFNKVLASADFAEFACNACNTHMHALASTEPFCVTCGAGVGDVHKTEAKVKPKVTAKSDMVAVHCSTCDHVTTLEESVANAIKASSKSSTVTINCASCGTEHVLSADALTAAEEDGTVGDTSLTTPDTPADPGDDFADPKAPTKASKKEAAGKAVASDLFDEDDLDLDDLDTIESNADNFKGKQAPPFKAKSEAEDTEEEDTTASHAQDLITPDVPVEADDMQIEPFSMDMDDDLEDFDVDSPAMTVMEDPYDEDLGFDEPEGDPLIDALQMDDTDIALAFVKANGRVLAVKGHVTIASFSKASAGDNFALANSSALPTATLAAVRSDGLRKGLQDVGFALVRVPVVANTAIIARKMQEVKAAVQTEEAKKRSEFPKVFALAAAGLNRGGWRGYENPLRAAFESELSSLGVQNPRRVVARIFESSGVEYSQTLLEVSNRLSKMSASARKEMAEMLEMTQVVAAVETSEESEDSAADLPIEARLQKPALLRPKLTASAEPQSYNAVTEILSGNRPLTFSGI